jgi:hypothetical protein
MDEPLKMSRERVQHLARLLVDLMDRSSSVRLLKDRELVRQSVIHALLEEIKQDEERHAHVRQKLLATLSAPAPGSREWDQAFRKLLDEEYDKQGFDAP